MNIFFLDSSPSKAAKFHNDKHVVKMILETAQLLSTAHAVLDNEGKQVEGMYKPTHVNHPCVVWIRDSTVNYDWTFVLFNSLLLEYTHRYGKIHKCAGLFMDLCHRPRNILLPENAEQKNYTSVPALAMPEEYKSSNPVESYRKYYMGEKRHIAKWTNREIPYWWA